MVQATLVGGGVVELALRGVVERIELYFNFLKFAEVWYEEDRTIINICAEEYVRTGVLEDRALHGDPYALWLFRVNHEMVKEYGDLQLKCPLSGPGHLLWKTVDELYFNIARLDFPLTLIPEGVFQKLDYDTRVKAMDEVKRRAYNLKNHYADRLARMLAGMKPSVRKELVERVKELNTHYHKLLPEEVIDILEKSRVEVKVVLSAEEALELYRRYGSNWREKVREAILEVVRGKGDGIVGEA